MVASLETDGHTDTAREAHQLLTEMISLSARMEDDLSLAEKSLSGIHHPIGRRRLIAIVPLRLGAYTLP